MKKKSVFVINLIGAGIFLVNYIPLVWAVELFGDSAYSEQSVMFRETWEGVGEMFSVVNVDGRDIDEGSMDAECTGDSGTRWRVIQEESKGGDKNSVYRYIHTVDLPAETAPSDFGSGDSFSKDKFQGNIFCDSDSIKSYNPMAGDNRPTTIIGHTQLPIQTEIIFPYSHSNDYMIDKSILFGDRQLGGEQRVTSINGREIDFDFSLSPKEIAIPQQKNP